MAISGVKREFQATAPSEPMERTLPVETMESAVESYDVAFDAGDLIASIPCQTLDDAAEWAEWFVETFMKHQRIPPTSLIYEVCHEL